MSVTDDTSLPENLGKRGGHTIAAPVPSPREIAEATARIQASWFDPLLRLELGLPEIPAVGSPRHPATSAAQLEEAKYREQPATAGNSSPCVGRRPAAPRHGAKTRRAVCTTR